MATGSTTSPEIIAPIPGLVVADIPSLAAAHTALDVRCKSPSLGAQSARIFQAGRVINRRMMFQWILFYPVFGYVFFADDAVVMLGWHDISLSFSIKCLTSAITCGYILYSA